MIRKRMLIPVGLLAATAMTTFGAGLELAQAVGPAERVRAALVYSAALLSIALAHELGHVLAARRHGVAASLPYFIPFPLGPPGTLGAIIRLPTSLPSRAAVLDIGASGPLLGFAVALPLLLFGHRVSELTVAAPADCAHPFLESPLALALAALRREDLFDQAWKSPVPGDSLITWLAARLAHGSLEPGASVRLGPLAFGAWVGLYLTMLNLIPTGQLDGGHVLSAVFGRRAERIGRSFSWLVLALGLFASWSWLALFVLIRSLGFGHPEPIDTRPVGAGRRAVAAACLLVFAATFVPVAFHF